MATSIDANHDPKKSLGIRRAPAARPTFSGFRRHGRTDHDDAIIVQDADGWEVPLQSANLSATGMFVASQLLFDVGEEHTLIFRSPLRERWFRVRARIVRVDAPDDENQVDDKVPGMAYEFVNTDEETWSQLCAVVESHP